MPGKHAYYSPSASKGWMKCAGRLVLEAAFPNLSNEFSDDGTACHEVAAHCLGPNGVRIPEDFIGQQIRVNGEHEQPARNVEFTEDLAEMTAGYVDTIKALRKAAVLCWIEWKGDFSHVIDVSDSTGTADCVLLFPLADGTYELMIVDLKTGWKFVEVVRNSQLMIYALAALSVLDMAYEITSVRLGIYAPRHGGMSEWSCSPEELHAFGEEAWNAVAKAELAKVHFVKVVTPQDRADWDKQFLHPNPNDEDCAYCRAMSTCPAAQAKVKASLSIEGFEAITEDSNPAKQLATELEEADALGADTDDYLGALMAATDFIEDWIKAVRAEVERRLLAGGKVEGFGLELGRAGARAWVDASEAETYLRKTVRLKLEDACDVKVKSPTSIEKMTKAKKGETALISKLQWERMQKNINRSDPKPSVKPAAAIKEPYSVKPPSADDFEVISDPNTEVL